jgi:hypothetical protein
VNGRVALVMRVWAVAVVVGLAAGLGWTFSAPDSRPAQALLLGALLLLALFPLANVVIALAAEWQRREWRFAAAAGAAAALLAYRFVLAMSSIL